MAHLDMEMAGLAALAARKRARRQTVKTVSQTPPVIASPVAVVAAPARRRKKKKGGLLKKLKKVAKAPIKLQKKLTKAPLKLVKKSATAPLKFLKKKKAVVKKAAVFGGAGVGAVLLNRGSDGPEKSSEQLARETGLPVSVIDQAEMSVEDMDPQTRIEIENKIASQGAGALQSPDVQAAIKPIASNAAEAIAERAAINAGLPPAAVDKIGDDAADAASAGASFTAASGAIAAEKGEPGAVDAAKQVVESAGEGAAGFDVKKALPLLLIGGAALVFLMRKRRG